MSIICYLICLRHLIWSITVTNRFFFSPIFIHACAKCPNLPSNISTMLGTVWIWIVQCVHAAPVSRLVSTGKLHLTLWLYKNIQKKWLHFSYLSIFLSLVSPCPCLSSSDSNIFSFIHPLSVWQSYWMISTFSDRQTDGQPLHTYTHTHLCTRAHQGNGNGPWTLTHNSSLPHWNHITYRLSKK